MAGWHKLRPYAASILIALSLSTGCGGRSEDSDHTGGAGGSGGTPETQGGKKSGATGGNSANGGSMSAGGSMAVGGSAQGGSDGCVYAGRVYAVGQTFKAGDGCNSCTCYGPNSIACTLVDCPDICSSTESEYLAAVEEAKRCNPATDQEQCTMIEPATLPCQCPTFVNPANDEATKQLAELRSTHEENSCGGNAICEACPMPLRGHCGASGYCEDSYSTGSASCLVNGTLYPHGAIGIQDPFSCNLCECFDGALGCTDIGCETPCPPDTIGGSRCVRCSSFSDCSIVETACLAPCDGTCTSPGQQCINGICQVECPIVPL